MVAARAHTGNDIIVTTAPTVEAVTPPDSIALDKAGYFVILPLAERRLLSVEHYSYDNTLLRAI